MATAIEKKAKVLDRDLLANLHSRQRKDLPIDKRLKFSDLRRICKNISKNIFHPTECCLWEGYVTNLKNDAKGTYVNFYFRKKKVALHRLLYLNFVDSLGEDEYLKFGCENKGLCCNVLHLKKFKYRVQETKPLKPKVKEKTPANTVSIKRESFRISFF